MPDQKYYFIGGRPEMKKILSLMLVCIMLLALCSTAFADGKLVLYYSHAAEWSDPIIQGFEDKYGVDVELVSLGTGECLSRIQAESANPQADIVWGGVVESYIPVADLLESYESTQIPYLYEGVYDTENFKWYAFDLEPMVMVYNTDIVKEAPTKWADLLKEDYFGKIATADPVKSSSAFACIMAIIGAYGQEDGGGYEFLEKMIPNLDSIVLSSSSSVYKGTADGEYSVGLTYEEAALRYRNEGASIEVVYPEEGTNIFMSPVTIVKGGPNTENAKLFVDYVLSEEVQSTLASIWRRSSRTDVALPEAFISTTDIPVCNYDINWVVENTEEFNEFWEEATL